MQALHPHKPALTKAAKSGKSNFLQRWRHPNLKAVQKILTEGTFLKASSQGRYWNVFWVSISTSAHYPVSWQSVWSKIYILQLCLLTAVFVPQLVHVLLSVCVELAEDHLHCPFRQILNLAFQFCPWWLDEALYCFTLAAFFFFFCQQ